MIQMKRVVSDPLLYIQQPESLTLPYVNIVKNVLIRLHKYNHFKNEEEWLKHKSLIGREKQKLTVDETETVKKRMKKENKKQQYFLPIKKNPPVDDSKRKRKLTTKQQLQILKSWPSYISPPTFEIYTEGGVVVGYCHYIAEEHFDIIGLNGKFIKRVIEQDIQKLSVFSS